MALPALNLRTANLDGPYIESLDKLDELNSVVVASFDPPGLHTWSSLQSARRTVAGEPDGLAFSDPWWELAPMHKDGTEPFVIDVPLDRSQVEYEATAKLGGFGVVRSMYKWPRVLYVEPTDRPNDKVTPYAGVVSAYNIMHPDRKRVFRQGDFSVANPIPLLVDFHTRPLRYFNAEASWSLQTESGERREPPSDWFGRDIQVGTELRYGTPPGPQQEKIAYMCLIGITATVGDEQFRACGSMLFDDAVNSPYKQSDAVQVLLKTCPYFDIGTTLSIGPRSELSDAALRFESMQ